jgi:hypothetical protein
MTQLYPPATAADTTHAKASAAKRLRSSAFIVTDVVKLPTSPSVVSEATAKEKIW